jgi:hypothetical protein
VKAIRVVSEGEIWARRHVIAARLDHLAGGLKRPGESRAQELLSGRQHCCTNTRGSRPSSPSRLVRATRLSRRSWNSMPTAEASHDAATGTWTVSVK